ncbi:DUF4349 domain-containing protein [Pseudonocardia abyssalis]|uniref:DUF4349 domain-containing protein n=1 Tax=Pseudonocardia abyssalis TaxID=2792008 RepID=A0ABS6V008_9PSEU|nr:DUF4349 domain-containing protein [Pseudonocardia abyssalis]MBW0119098.1 DUF4349 domain-containing protein [Pseudonocardia abyssalis]MBW0137845.1 DUF4349 domain-containing protein [Pseudonocardia abyssalis]
MSRRVVVAVATALLVLAGLAVVLVDGGGGGSASGDSASVSSAPSIGFAEPAPERSGGLADESAAAPSVAPAAPGVPVGAVERSLVRTAEVTVEVADAVAGVRDVRAAAVAAGGFVAEERSGDHGGSVVLRVPADALDRVLDAVGAVGEVTDRSSSVVDATEQVVDLDARVASQQASVARVRALLAEATTIGEVVAIESELTSREAELDSLTGRLAAVRDQVAFSTLTVDLRVPHVGADDEPPSAAGFGPGLAAGWEGLLALGTGVGTVLGFLLPFVPVVALPAGLAWLLVRRRRRSTPAT